jgi:hypothetical protein
MNEIKCWVVWFKGDDFDLDPGVCSDDDHLMAYRDEASALESLSFFGDANGPPRTYVARPARIIVEEP